MVMIEYQLVPLFQSISAETQLTNSSSIDFQIQLSDPFPSFAPSHIQLVGDLGTCQPGSLSGNGTNFVYTVTDCVDGQVGISIPENSISEQGYSGPEQTQRSEMVEVDRTAPEIVVITQEESQLQIPITEPVLQPETDSYSFESSNSACQVDSVTTSGDQMWLATLVGCEDSSFSFTIVANSISDLAGNTGPAEDISFAVVVTLPEVTPTPEPTASPEVTPTPEPTASPEVTPTPEPTPKPTASPEVELAPTQEPTYVPATEPIMAPESEVATPAQVVANEPTQLDPEVGLAEEVLAPEAELETLPTEDSEVTQAPTQRRQAAQSVITASTASDPANSSLGWAVGLAIAGALLLAAGLSLRRRGISDLLVS
jgi:hypothetical protein